MIIEVSGFAQMFIGLWPIRPKCLDRNHNTRFHLTCLSGSLSRASEIFKLRFFSFSHFGAKTTYYRWLFLFSLLFLKTVWILCLLIFMFKRAMIFVLLKPKKGPVLPGCALPVPGPGLAPGLGLAWALGLVLDLVLDQCRGSASTRPRARQ